MELIAACRLQQSTAQYVKLRNFVGRTKTLKGVDSKTLLRAGPEVVPHIASLHQDLIRLRASLSQIEATTRESFSQHSNLRSALQDQRWEELCTVVTNATNDCGSVRDAMTLTSLPIILSSAYLEQNTCL